MLDSPIVDLTVQPLSASFASHRNAACVRGGARLAGWTTTPKKSHQSATELSAGRRQAAIQAKQRPRQHVGMVRRVSSASPAWRRQIGPWRYELDHKHLPLIRDSLKRLEQATHCLLDPSSTPVVTQRLGKQAHITYRDGLAISRMRHKKAAVTIQRAYRGLLVRREAHAEWLLTLRPKRKTRRASTRRQSMADVGSVLRDLDLEQIEGELPTDVGAAAIAFDSRHVNLNIQARGLLASTCLSGGTSHRVNQWLRRSDADVRRNRFFVPEKYDPFPYPIEYQQKKWERRKRWTLDESIWKPRKLKGNSRDFYETVRHTRAASVLTPVDAPLARSQGTPLQSSACAEHGV